MTVVGQAITHTAKGTVLITDKYECSWFDGVKLQKAVFKGADIKLIERHV
jgi:uncharacterized protein YodC (DUF2158 family)